AVGPLPPARPPAMTFTGAVEDIDRLPDAPFGVTSRPEHRPVAETLGLEMGGEPFFVAEEDRRLYHAALVTGANHLVTLVAEAADLLRSAGGGGPGRAPCPPHPPTGPRRGRGARPCLLSSPRRPGDRRDGRRPAAAAERPARPRRARPDHGCAARGAPHPGAGGPRARGDRRRLGLRQPHPVRPRRGLRPLPAHVGRRSGVARGR